MPLTTLPQNWAPNDTIPSAWANNIGLDVSLLDARTGGDPGAANRFLAANGALSAAWRFLNTNDFGAGIIPSSALAERKVNTLNVLYASFAAALAGGSHFIDIGATPDGPNPTDGWMGIQTRHYNYAAGDYRFFIACAHRTITELYVQSVFAGTPSPWYKLWHAGNDGVNSGLDADVLRGLVPGNASGQVPVSNGVENVNLNAALLNGQTAAQIIAAAAGSVPGLAAGIGAYWTGAATAIPTGWIRHSALDGRLLVGDGTTFSVDFAVNGQYGTSWGHSHVFEHSHLLGNHTHGLGGHVHGIGHEHTLSGHTHSGSSLGVSGSTGNNSGSGQSGGTGTSRADSPHTHDAGSLDVSGDTAGPSSNGTGGGPSNSGTPSAASDGNNSDSAGVHGTTSTNAFTWLPPMWGVVWVMKS